MQIRVQLVGIPNLLSFLRRPIRLPPRRQRRTAADSPRQSSTGPEFPPGAGRNPEEAPGSRLVSRPDSVRDGGEGEEFRNGENVRRLQSLHEAVGRPPSGPREENQVRTIDCQISLRTREVLYEFEPRIHGSLYVCGRD
ncbi:unnamed protein product [Linum tenue]|uniref:Uncharacterized protein n=1 Tax=Linum tenue TaxID=586396 RepID=A0AAV0JS05_9ROSI|nr:unnamed protein product [Linum tenue]